MVDLFSRLLEPFLWSLVNVSGTLKKTSKVVFGKYLEKLGSFSDYDFNSSAIVINAMEIIQKLRGENCTFDGVLSSIFDRILNIGYRS